MITKSHQSLFRYPLTRAYPYPWFTWVVAIGGIASVSLFSFVNLIANGYVLHTVYTESPNSTLAQYDWFNRQPWSLASKMSPECAPAILTPGAEYFTSNLGLRYTLEQINKVQPNGSAGDIIPAVSYLNTPLTDCVIGEVDVMMRRLDSSTASHGWESWADSYAYATARCTIPTNGFSAYLNFTVQLPKMIKSGNGKLLNAFIDLDAIKQPSMWWGAQLMNVWYVPISTSMTNEIPGKLPLTNPFSDPSVVRYDTGEIYTQRNFNISDLTSADFFRVMYVFRHSDGSMSFSGSWELEPLGTNWTDAKKEPYISRQWDVFAKSFYSTVLSDLGQSGEMNGVADSDSLNYLLGILENVSQHDMGVQHKTLEGYPLAKAYEQSRDTLPSLKVNSATIFAQYTCSVPKLKDPFSLIVSIFVADLVLLQGLWQLLNFATTTYLETKDEGMNFCEGCASRERSRNLVGEAYKNLDALSMQSRSASAHSRHSESSAG